MVSSVSIFVCSIDRKESKKFILEIRNFDAIIGNLLNTGVYARSR